MNPPHLAHIPHSLYCPRRKPPVHLDRFPLIPPSSHSHHIVIVSLLSYPNIHTSFVTSHGTHVLPRPRCPRFRFDGFAAVSLSPRLFQNCVSSLISLSFLLHISLVSASDPSCPLMPRFVCALIASVNSLFLSLFLFLSISISLRLLASTVLSISSTYTSSYSFRPLALPSLLCPSSSFTYWQHLTFILSLLILLIPFLSSRLRSPPLTQSIRTSHLFSPKPPAFFWLGFHIHNFIPFNFLYLSPTTLHCLR